MSENQPKKSKAPKKKTALTFWIIVSALILVYLIFRFVAYSVGESDELYEVSKGQTGGALSSIYTAVALREETVIKSEDSGYINFFIGDATPVSVGAVAYVIDEEGSLSAKLTESSENQILLNENDLNQIKTTIYDFDNTYDRDSYYETYSFKYMVQSQILDLINSSAFESIDAAASSSYGVFTSGISGIMQHSVDGYEGYNLDNLEAAAFRKANYVKKIIKSNDYVELGEEVYKVVTSDDWKLVFQLDDLSEADNFGKTVTVSFLSDGISAVGSFETLTRAGESYGIISLEKYMIRYISERFIRIQILGNSSSGLKIPKTSVGEEDFYIIPSEFMTQGGNSSGYGFLLKDDSTSAAAFTECRIAMTTDEYCYVSRDTFDEGDVLIKPDSNDEYTIKATGKLEGAYIYSGGGYVFKVVEILGEENSYFIISDSTDDGLRLYDRILRNVSGND